MAAYGFPRTGPNSQDRQNNELGLAIGGPVLQPPTEYNPSTGKGSFPSPTPSSPLSQSPRTPTRHLRTPSQLDNVVRENAQLRRELENLRAKRDQTQDACDNMLTDLITTQETLRVTQRAIAEKDAELSVLRERLVEEPLSRGGEQELRDLRIRYSRLQLEADQKDKQLQQARADMHESNGSRSSHSPRNREALETQERLMEAEQRINQTERLYQDASNQADTYLKQKMEWKNAYDGLQESYNGLQRSHHELSQAFRETQSGVDNRAAQKLQALHAALNASRRMEDFWKQNSEKLSKRNKEVMGQLRNLQDALDSKSREVDQQKSMIEALQLQMH
jgi:chromosome segregation ATPase